MPPKIPEIITCDSNEAWEHELRLVADGLALDETEDTWEHIARAVQRLNALTKGSAADFPKDIVSAVRNHIRPIVSALNSERSRLTGTATDLVLSLATHLGRQFAPLLPHLVPTLLGLATRTNKLLISRAKSCLLAIAEFGQLPSLLPQLRDAVTNKSVSLRLVSTEVTLKCLNCFDPSDLETNARAEDIEAIIRTTARDASADVRKVSRKIFEAYKILLPQRVATFIDPLSPVTKKYLDIKPKDTAALSSSSSNLHTNLQKSSRPFSASSSSVPTESRRPADPGARLHGHIKSSTVGSHGAMREIIAGPSTVPAEKNKAVPTEDVKPPRPQGTGPMRPPPHMRHAIMSKPSTEQAIRPALGRFPSRPASAQSTHSMPPPPEPRSTREPAKRPPRPESVPPQSTSDSKSKSASTAAVTEKAPETRSRRPELALSQSGGFQKTSSSLAGDFVPNRAARRVKRVDKEIDDEVTQKPKVRDAEKVSGRDTHSKGTLSSKAREVDAGGSKEPAKRTKSDKTNLQTNVVPEKPSKPVERSRSRTVAHPPIIKPELPTREPPPSTAPQNLPSTEVSREPTAQKPEHPQVQTRTGVHAPTISQLAKRKALPPSAEAKGKVQKKTKYAVQPLAIRKINRQPAHDDHVNDQDIKGEGMDIEEDIMPIAHDGHLSEPEDAVAVAAEIPLPASPPSSEDPESSDGGLPVFRLDVPPLPTPLRDVNAMKYRVAATPISALLFSIERGFEDSLPEGSPSLDMGDLMTQDILEVPIRT